MSLLKAIKGDIQQKDTEVLKDTFLDIIETIVAATETPTREDVSVLVQIYAEYSVQYLATVASTLEAQPTLEAGMKFMNSYIAEVVHGANLHYYHQEGWTLVDKPIQKALDNKGRAPVRYILDIIDEIEASYAEEEIEAE